MRLGGIKHCFKEGHRGCNNNSLLPLIPLTSKSLARLHRLEAIRTGLGSVALTLLDALNHLVARAHACKHEGRAPRKGGIQAGKGLQLDAHRVLLDRLAQVLDEDAQLGPVVGGAERRALIIWDLVMHITRPDLGHAQGVADGDGGRLQNLQLLGTVLGRGEKETQVSTRKIIHAAGILDRVLVFRCGCRHLLKSLGTKERRMIYV